MAGSSAALIEELPARFRANGSAPLNTRVRLRVGRLVRDVVLTPTSCAVEPPSGDPAVEIRTDHDTWGAIEAGVLSGIEAFGERKLSVRGSVEKALQFEPLFERPSAGALRYTIKTVRAGDLELSVLAAGAEDAPPLLLLHGLGATKASWLTVVPALARRYRVLAVDMPGFGASSKPLGRYQPCWMSDRLFDLADALDYEQIYVAGNSMGGRLAMEMALERPERVRAIACLCPATAFSHRPLVQIARILRAEFGILVTHLPRKTLKDGLRQLFADHRRLEEVWFDAAIDDFLQIWRSPRARLAFFAAARNIYLEEPYGENGFWARLSQMEPSALYIYGGRDVLITPRFSARVQTVLPSAEVAVWDDCGHVPQLEHPARTARHLIRFFDNTAATRRLRAG